MILLLGNSDDVLLREVDRLLKSRGVSRQHVSESDLFSNTPFCFEQRGRSFSGSLRVNHQDVQFADISGVLVRLTRVWSPPAGFDLQDQIFIYHENGAAWFALLAGLPCPAVNRPALSCWVQDLTSPEALVRQLAARLRVSTGAFSPPSPGIGRPLPTRPPALAQSVSFYAVNGGLISRSITDEPLARGIERRALAEWQRETDLPFCRLDFERFDGSLRLAHVESHPLLDEEPGGVVEKVAAAITEVLA